MHVERQVVMAAGVLAGGARSFPSAEGLVSRPGTGGRALRPIGVSYAGLDILEEPVRLFIAAINPAVSP